MDKTKRFAIVFSVVGLLLILTGVTYSFFNYTKTGLANNFRVGNISFNSTQDGNINLTNVFPITSSELSTDVGNHDSVSVSITGSTDYSNGIEYLVSFTEVNNKVNNKKIPISFTAEVSGLGTSSDDYYNERGNTNIYTLSEEGKVKNGEYILVGFINGNSQSINGTVTITAFIDADRILISDTTNIEGGTPSEMTIGKTVFTTTEWNSLASNPINFKVKVEANLGTWVRDLTAETPDSCFTTTESKAIYTYNSNRTQEDINNCVSYFENSNYGLEEGESFATFCAGTGALYGSNILSWINYNQFSDLDFENLENFNIITLLGYETTIEAYDDSCGVNVVIPETITVYDKSYRINPNPSQEDIDNCAYYLGVESEWEPDSSNGETIEDFCAGTGTFWGETLQNYLDNKTFGSYSMQELENDNIFLVDLIPHEARVASLANSSFLNMNIETVIIPEGITEIESSAFKNNKLDEVIIPDSITQDICDYFIFDNDVTITHHNNIFTCGCFSTSTTNNAITIDRYDLYCGKDAVIPSTIDGKTVVAIGNFAFEGKQLQSVTIPNTVTTIGNSCFANNKLTSVVIPDSVTSVGTSSFSNNNISNITFSNSMTEISSGAFSQNDLTSLTIPNNITTIGSNAFSRNKLTNLVLPNSVTNVGQGSFKNNLLTAVTIPGSITTISDSAFDSNQITDLTISNGVTNIGDYAFNNNRITNLVIPDSVTRLGYNSFANNTITSLTLGSGLSQNTNSNSSGYFHPYSLTLSNIHYIDKETINSSLFSNTNGNTLRGDLTLGPHVKTIDYSAFNNQRLTSVTIPDNVEVIHDLAFSQNNLTSVTIGSGIISMTSGTFFKDYNSNTNLKTITVNKSCSDVRTITGYPWVGERAASRVGVSVYGSNNELCDSW